MRIAESLGEDVDASFKTLVCEGADGGYVVCCVPVAQELDLKRRCSGRREEPRCYPLKTLKRLRAMFEVVVRR